MSKKSWNSSWFGFIRSTPVGCCPEFIIGLLKLGNSPLNRFFRFSLVAGDKVGFSTWKKFHKNEILVNSLWTLVSDRHYDRTNSCSCSWWDSLQFFASFATLLCDRRHRHPLNINGSLPPVKRGLLWYTGPEISLRRKLTASYASTEKKRPLKTDGDTLKILKTPFKSKYPLKSFYCNSYMCKTHQRPNLSAFWSEFIFI